MPSHLSTIGFSVSSEADFIDLAERAAAQSLRVRVADGIYLRWSCASGAELWLQLDPTGDLIGMNPHFAGRNTVRVGLTATVGRSEDTPLDGAYHGWVEPQSEDPASGAYPLVFDCPSFATHVDLALPSVAEVQLTAFAHELSVYDTEAEFEAGQTEEPRFAAESFIPAGLIAAKGEEDAPPEAYAILTGRVLAAERRRNSMSGASFYWASVRCLAATYDIVADSVLVEQPPRAGGVISGAFWFSGRPLGGDRGRN